MGTLLTASSHVFSQTALSGLWKKRQKCGHWAQGVKVLSCLSCVRHPKHVPQGVCKGNEAFSSDTKSVSEVQVLLHAEMKTPIFAQHLQRKGVAEMLWFSKISERHMQTAYLGLLVWGWWSWRGHYLKNYDSTRQKKIDSWETSQRVREIMWCCCFSRYLWGKCGTFAKRIGVAERVWLRGFLEEIFRRGPKRVSLFERVSTERI